MSVELELPFAKGIGDYLGPLCPVCHVPWLAHPIPDLKSGCFPYAPARTFLLPPDPERIEAREVDAMAIEESRERYRLRIAQKTSAMPIRIPDSAWGAARKD